jgi:hypothetical protein
MGSAAVRSRVVGATAAGVVACALVVASGSGSRGAEPAAPRPVVGPVVAAVGDAACAPGARRTPTRCRQRSVSELVVTDATLAAFLALGDLQYEHGGRAAFAGPYDESYGRAKAITRPVPGNHEYDTPDARGYYRYFGALAGDPTTGYYSFDVGTWHVVALNSNCDAVSCAAGSAQDRWLRADLADHPGACTLAFWHHPRFSSGWGHGDDPGVAPFWDALQSVGAEIVLNGHEHVYERFAPQRPDRSAAPDGIRQFTVGTGGKEHTGFATPAPNSEVRIDRHFGVLRLTLGTDAYSWEFVGERGGVLDAGSGACH